MKYQGLMLKMACKYPIEHQQLTEQHVINVARRSVAGPPKETPTYQVTDWRTISAGKDSFDGMLSLSLSQWLPDTPSRGVVRSGGEQ